MFLFNKEIQKIIIYNTYELSIFIFSMYLFLYKYFFKYIYFQIFNMTFLQIEKQN